MDQIRLDSAQRNAIENVWKGEVAPTYKKWVDAVVNTGAVVIVILVLMGLNLIYGFLNSDQLGLCVIASQLLLTAVFALRGFLVYDPEEAFNREILFSHSGIMTAYGDRKIETFRDRLFAAYFCLYLLSAVPSSYFMIVLFLTMLVVPGYCWMTSRVIDLKLRVRQEVRSIKTE